MVARDTKETVDKQALDADALIAKWIEPDPVRGGRGDVRLKEYCVHVWALIGHLPEGERGERGVASVAEAYDIPLEAARAALAYYERHKAFIDDRLDANAA